MKGASTLVWGIVIIVVIVLGAIGAYYLLGGSGGDTTITMRDIVQKNLGYKCAATFSIPNMGSNKTNKSAKGTINVYLHGVMLRLDGTLLYNGAAAKVIYVDRNILNKHIAAYEILQVGDKKEGESISGYRKEDQLPPVYNTSEWNRPLYEELRDYLKRDFDIYGGQLKISLDSIQCGLWVPDDSYFQPPR